MKLYLLSFSDEGSAFYFVNMYHIYNTPYLICRTKNAVRDLDNLNYRKMKKILMIDHCDDQSTIGDDGKQLTKQLLSLLINLVTFKRI